MVHGRFKVTSDESVVQNYEDDENTIKEGECNEELVEGIFHLMGGQHKNGEDVASKTKQAKDWLQNLNSDL